MYATFSPIIIYSRQKYNKRCDNQRLENRIINTDNKDHYSIDIKDENLDHVIYINEEENFENSTNCSIFSKIFLSVNIFNKINFSTNFSTNHIEDIKYPPTSYFSTN